MDGVAEKVGRSAIMSEQRKWEFAAAASHTSLCHHLPFISTLPSVWPLTDMDNKVALVPDQDELMRAEIQAMETVVVVLCHGPLGFAADL